MLLEDAVDVTGILLGTGRTLRPERWCQEIVDEINRKYAENFF
jgi:hypothetical protein